MEETEGYPTEEPTTAPAGSILAIDRGVVHQICSGQVVLSLATAVKELLENSLDAGSSVVDIKLVDHGATSVEVTDNGSGVEESNFAGLTLKHHTSKLREFTDLFSVETFGFRGEALSSLCALSILTISTRHKSSPTGTLLTYDHDGLEVNRSKVARPVGTTVSLSNIFSTMPVRQKEFQRSIKREFSRLVSVVSAYGLVSLGVRLTCSNTTGKGKRVVVVQTTGQGGLADNLVSIFGAKQMANLRPICQVEMSIDDLTEAGIKHAGPLPSIVLEGFISSPVHGEGRGAPDRQFYFVNNRPCDPSKLSKLVNQVYHGYNRHQYPFVHLNIRTLRSSVDVNLTPDKRQVLLQHERLLQEVVRRSLEKMFSDAPFTLALSTVGRPVKLGGDCEAVSEGDEDVVLTMTNGTPSMASGSSPNIASGGLNLASLKRRFSSVCSSTEPKGDGGGDRKKQKTLQNFFSVKSEENLGEYSDREDEVFEGGDKSVKYEPEVTQLNNVKRGMSLDTSNGVKLIFDDLHVINSELGQSQDVKPVRNDEPAPDPNNITPYATDVKVIFEELPAFEIKESSINSYKQSMDDDKVTMCKNNSDLKMVFEEFNPVDTKEPFDEANKVNVNGTETNRNAITNSRGVVPENDFRETNNGVTVTPKVSLEYGKPTVESRTRGKVVELPFSISKLSTRRRTAKKDEENMTELKFKARISPTDNKSAEAELQKQLQKSDFAEMKIFGQFNLGFLIVGLRHDIFIIDQHASDEKYNFETLQQTTQIKSQKMVVPQRLELTAVSESILMDNLAVFEKNGFLFDIASEAPVTQRISLTSLPISKNWTFGKEDIDELIFMLSEGAGDIGGPCRPTRVRAMFASRACRSSVMVGTSLAMPDMVRLVSHMGTMEQPWNCPHGRPTIRHLVNTDMIR